MADPLSEAELERVLSIAEEMTRSSTRAAAEAHRMLGDLLSKVREARLRGQIRQQMWVCERLCGARQQFFSQAGQDAYLDEHVFCGKRNGVFIEIGGYDGITGSNCLFFEMLRGWSGVLIEPAPSRFEDAASFRRATCLPVAVAAVDGVAEFLEVRSGYLQMSGLTQSYDINIRQKVEADPRHEGHLIRVETKTLASILDASALTEIDYISLDVEGGEMAVLETFPFDRFSVRAWTVENNTASRAIPALMRDKGYHRIEALGVDDVYVRAGT